VIKYGKPQFQCGCT